MKLSDYDKLSAEFAIYRSRMYPVVGLFGEAGEFADKVAKMLRREDWLNCDSLLDLCTLDERDKLLDELGDVLWMLAACARELESSLEVIADMNIRKLTSRKARGVIDGSGDNR